MGSLVKSLIVARREYMGNVRTKTFWIGIFIFPIILTLSILVPILLEKTKEARTYAVLDESGWLLDAVRERVTAQDFEKILQAVKEKQRKGGEAFDRLPDLLKRLAPSLEAVPDEQLSALAWRIAAGPAVAPETAPPPAPDNLEPIVTEYRQPLLTWWETVSTQEAGKIADHLHRSRFILKPESGAVEEMNRRITNGELFAYFVIGKDPVAGNEGCKYVSNNLTDEDLKNWFSDHATEMVRAKRLVAKGIDEATSQWVQSRLQFQGKKLSTEGGEEEEVKSFDVARQWAPVAFVYLLWISVFSIAQMLLTNTIEEKSSRIIEVLLSSVSPYQLMTGKIIGMAATGLTVVGTWVLFFFTAIKMLPLLLREMPPIDLGQIAADPIYILSFVMYFFLGYLFYAALLVGIGSVCNSLQEAQNLQWPVMIMLMVPLFAMTNIGKDPNGTLAKLLSFFPPFTPFVMMNRAAGPPQTWEYVVTTLLLLIVIPLTFLGAGKIFRIGILMTGKPPKLGEMLRWLRAGAGTVPVRRESESG